MDTSVSLNYSNKPSSLWLYIGAGLDAVVRRLLDILAAFFGLLLLSPVFLLVAILLRRDSSGPIFYRGPRVGKNGRRFGILKFRTMYERPESYAGPSVTGSQDDRITPFGHWLRDTKVNELPQLWNVLIGDMSLVGPRPEDPGLAAEWPAEIREEILSVRPGITSPASVLYREEEQMLSSDHLLDDYFRDVLPSKLRLDLLYVRQRTILNDLDLIFMTFIALLPQLRRRSIPEYLLYSGPLSQFFSLFVNWFFLDSLISLVAVGIAGGVWRLSGPLQMGFGRSVMVAILIALSFSLINVLLRVNRTSWRTASASAVTDLAISAALSTLVVLLFNRGLWKPYALPEGMLVLTGVLAFLGAVVVRYRERVLTGLASRWLAIRRKANTLGERVLIVGAGEMGEFASWMIKRGEFSRAFSVVGFVDDNPQKVGLLVDSTPVVGITSDIPDLICKLDIGVVIFAISNITQEQRQRILSLCCRAPAQMVFFPNVMDMVRSSLSPKSQVPVEWVRRDEVYQLLGELDNLLMQNSVETIHARLTEMQKQFS